MQLQPKLDIIIWINIFKKITIFNYRSHFQDFLKTKKKIKYNNTHALSSAFVFRDGSNAYQERRSLKDWARAKAMRADINGWFEKIEDETYDVVPAADPVVASSVDFPISSITIFDRILSLYQYTW